MAVTDERNDGMSDPHGYNLSLWSQIEDEPGRHDLWLRLGQSLRNDGRNKEAVEALRRAIELKPDDSVAWLFLALAYRAVGNLEEAGHAWQKVVDYRADFPFSSDDDFHL